MPHPLHSRTSLVSRNVSVGGRRTSVRLEPDMWEALHEMAERENTPLSAIVTRIDAERRASTLTSAIREHLVRYYRSAATENGHRIAGHGTLEPV